MTVTYGFYNSVGSDRVYDALQMGQMFDGLILPGVYEQVGDHLDTVEDSGMDIFVGSGRAWFKNTWTYNDANLGLSVPTADALLPRIDLVYLEVNMASGVRANEIDIMEGTPASSPVPPTLTQSGDVWQYPLAEIEVGAAVTSITDNDITIIVGTEDCPFVTGFISGNIIDHDHTAGYGGALGASGLLTNSVTEPKIAASSVSEAKIATGAVTNTKIGTDAVTESKIADGAVTVNRLGTSAVTAIKIQNRTRTIFLPPMHIVEADAFDAMIILADGVTSEVKGMFKVPKDFVSGMTVKPVVIASASGNIYSTWTITYGGVGEAIDTHTHTASQAATALTLYLLSEIQSLSISNAAVGDYAQLGFQRIGESASDTINDAVLFIGWLITYTADS